MHQRDIAHRDIKVENILINSSCANVSNISVSGWAFTNGNSYGYFNENGSSFPFADGVILSTGRAASAVGPNTNLLSEGPTNWPGDIDLQNAINENNTINATVIEFDFLPFANKVSFAEVLAICIKENADSIILAPPDFEIIIKGILCWMA